IKNHANTAIVKIQSNKAIMVSLLDFISVPYVVYEGMQDRGNSHSCLCQKSHIRVMFCPSMFDVMPTKILDVYLH
ncbi:MAG: hypothetical protein WAQ56_02350, partial [Candidatus Nitrotoga sp.]